MNKSSNMIVLLREVWTIEYFIYITFNCNHLFQQNKKQIEPTIRS